MLVCLIDCVDVTVFVYIFTFHFLLLLIAALVANKATGVRNISV